METAIKLEHLTKTYGKNRGIIDLNLTVKQGDIFGFIGPNGAGKSTTIRTMLGLISAKEGTISIFGKTQKSKKEVLSQIGYMPSETMFYPGMRVEEVIRLSAGLYQKDCTKEAEGICERLDLDRKKRVEELSLGNRKKVSIVCALQHDPRLYILDEPTSGLDPLMQREFFALLEEKNKKGATVFLSSHVLSEIEHHCRHAAIIREGRLLVSDTVEALSRTSARRVHLIGADRVPRITGMSDVQTKGEQTEFLYQGDMNQLVAALSEITFRDLTISEPDLEEIFMHFYGKGCE